jgi:hypothetical protein
MTANSKFHDPFVPQRGIRYSCHLYAFEITVNSKFHDPFVPQRGMVASMKSPGPLQFVNGKAVLLS